MTKPQRPITTKDFVSRESLRLFVEHGYNAVSMRDIATAVGIRQSAIYNHFRSKQDILVALMRQTMEQISEGLDHALGDADDPETLLNRFVRFHIGFHIDQPAVSFLSYMELRGVEADHLPDILAMRDAYEARLRTILSRGQAAGTFQLDDPAIQARAILAMLTGVTVWYREGGPLERQRVINCYVRAALQSVGLTITEGER